MTHRHTWSAYLALLALPACSGKRAPTSSPPPSDPTHEVASAPPLTSALPAVDAAASAPAQAGASADAAVAAPAALEGTDFEAQAKELFRVAACGGEGPVPERLDAAVVDAHCKELRAMYDDYRNNWVKVAMPYIAALVPKDIPTTVVYPFGGGDLLSALATFPAAPEITTISLEAAGDIRKIDTIGPKQLKMELGLNRLHLGKLFEKAHSRTINLDLESKSDLPGEIIFTMVALAVHGYEPVSLRYFRLKPDGTLHYLDTGEIAQREKEKAAKGETKVQASLEIFADMELQFRKTGDASAPVKVLRHIAFNLDDKHMAADPSLLHHLEAKGKVTAMTKAASHFLWSDDFSTIRKYLLDHMAWMISDSTGVPPKYATKAGFVQDTYGIMEWPAAFGPVDNKNAEDLRRLFKTNPQKDLPFRYGYPDRDHHGHMVITRKAN